MPIHKLTEAGRYLRRLLPPRFHFAIPPDLPEQVCLGYRRCVLVPVRLQYHPSQTISNMYCRWLTSFIFAAQDYNLNNCFFEAPPGISCSRKKANEAFIFLALYVLTSPSPHPLSANYPSHSFRLNTC